MLGTQNRRRARSSRSGTQSPTRDLDQRQHRSIDKSTSGKLQAKEKTFMDRWVEPSLAENPSYRDHGGSAYGVLEHMQPLGEAPGVKVKARMKPENTRKSIGTRLAGAADGEGQDTPEGTPGPSSALASQQDLPPPPPHVDVDDERDADFAPRGSTATSKRKERSTRSLGTNKRGVTAAPSTPSTQKSTEKASGKSKTVPGRKYTDKKLKQVVEAAKNRAVELGKPNTAGAVHQLYIQCLSDDHLVQLLEAILTQTADTEQLNEFHAYVRVARKKSKAAKEKKRAGPPEAANGALHSETGNKPMQQSQTTHTASTRTDLPPSSTKAKLSLKVKSPIKPTRGRPPGKMKVSPAKRSGSVASDSSLTSMTSNEDDDDEVNDLDQPQAAATVPVARPSSKVTNPRAKDHATQHGSLAAPQRGLKRSSAEAELQDDGERERTLAKKKQRLSLLVERGEDFPESNIRPARDGTLSTRTRAQQATKTTFSDFDSPVPSPRSAHLSRNTSLRPDDLPPKTFGRKAKIKQSPEKKTVSGYNGLSGVSGAGPESPIGADDNEVELRDYFEGVSGDKQGNFIEAVHARSRNRAGYDEAPDYTRIKDAKGNTVLCYSCSKSSEGTRPLIQCDYCGQHWHLDCLDPPPANPPALNKEGRKFHDWMCPLHADQELRKFDTRLLYPRRTIHIRKPRNAKVVETSLKRGFRNNGVIEIVDDTSDDSDSEFYDEETQDEGVVYRLPASGIKLDFIDKVKNSRVQELRNEVAHRSARPAASPPKQLEQANFARRSFQDKQMALILAQFASANRDLALDGDDVGTLVATLIAEAPAEVVNEMTAAEDNENAYSASSAAPPSPPSSEQIDQLSAVQRKQMQMLAELIRRRLDIGKT